MLEKMGDFFHNRLDGYDEHMLTIVNSAKEFYSYTASLLPMQANCMVMDLGCGTGLELAEYFKMNPTASITGIDLAEGMLSKLKAKFPDKCVKLINASYFDVPFGDGIYDAAVSVESLHHFTREQKIPLYMKLHNSLKTGGYFILTDYMVEDDAQEAVNFADLERIRNEQNITDNEFYHYDTPLTVQHETEALLAGGFSQVELLNKWHCTHCLKAYY